MDEADKKLRKRRRHIKEATDVNRKHADMMKTESIARHDRSRIQVRSEVMENRQIDYKAHMKWLDNFYHIIYY
ncbi:hypothetical protein JK161_00370 [Leuconostoc mesenteroides]|uniref:hypothetical protein n=1 Tax=Leuconostoc mesenteroides TaxID=1245 RepID=UPI001B8AC57C|nr:hypothetical protein [Leuconostoc mesenteroides]MBS0941299.1 hypothetical protein [Leuconostoc mesenteroides]